MKYLQNAIVGIMLNVLLYINTSAAENSSILYKKGAEAANSGNYDEAEDIFKKVISLSPDFTLGHYGLGKLLLYKQGNAEKAQKELETAVSLDKSNSKAYFYLGFAYLYQKKYIPAIHAFNEAYNTDRTCIEALYNIGAIYDLMDSSFKSEKYFKKWRTEKIRLESDQVQAEDL